MVTRGGFGRQAERAARMAAQGRRELQEQMLAVRNWVWFDSTVNFLTAAESTEGQILT